MIRHSCDISLKKRCAGEHNYALHVIAKYSEYNERIDLICLAHNKNKTQLYCKGLKQALSLFQDPSNKLSIQNIAKKF